MRNTPTESSRIDRTHRPDSIRDPSDGGSRELLFLVGSLACAVALGGCGNGMDVLRQVPQQDLEPPASPVEVEVPETPEAPPETPPEVPPDPCAEPCPAPAACAALVGCDPDAPSAERCVYAPAADGTACDLRGQGDGLCHAGGCVDCLTDADCAERVDNSAGCYAVACLDHACNAELRHDGPGWVVQPTFTDELFLGSSGAALEAIWDGENFLVAMPGGASGWLGQRVSAAGAFVGQAFALPAGLAGLAFAPELSFAGQTGVYLAISSQPSAFLPGLEDIAGTVLSRDGTVLKSTFALIYAGGRCPAPFNPSSALAPTVAASATSFAVTAQYNCLQIVGRSWPGDATFDFGDAYWRPAGVSAFGGGASPSPVLLAPWVPAGGGGGKDLWGASTFGAYFQQLLAYDINTAPNAIVPRAASATWGADSWLLAYEFGELYVELRAPNLARLSGPIPFQGNYQGPTPTLPIEAGFDGNNFLVVTRVAGWPYPQLGLPNLTAMRVSRSGVILDPVQFDLTPDAEVESRPQLAGDRAGRHLIAYTKADGRIFARLFSTCP